MTLSPVENANLSVQSALAFAESERRVVVGGLVVGPLFGWLGQRWRARRAWVGALATAAALCLEPLARIPVGQVPRFRSVWLAEVAVGVALAAYVVLEARSGSRPSG
jgi:hypothetical protein